MTLPPKNVSQGDCVLSALEGMGTERVFTMVTREKLGAAPAATNHGAWSTVCALCARHQQCKIARNFDPNPKVFQCIDLVAKDWN